MEPVMTNPGKFHPSQRCWPQGMPESIAQTNHKLPDPSDVPHVMVERGLGGPDSKESLNLVHVYCPNTGCDYHVRVDEKVKDYNLNKHLHHCIAPIRPQEAPGATDREAPRDSPTLDSEELRTAPMPLSEEVWFWSEEPPSNFEEGKTSRHPIEDLVPGESILGPAEELLPPYPTVLEEAAHLVDGPREAHYGHPYDDFSRVIGAFNALFVEYLKQPLETRHWPLIMQLCKLSREVHEPKRDNWVDGAGYWRTLEKVSEREDH